MPRAFLITNRRYFAHKISNSTVFQKEEEFLENVNTEENTEKTFDGVQTPKSPPTTTMSVPRQSCTSTFDDGNSSDCSYSSSPGYETRPDLSPQMECRYDCSDHISMLFDFITQSPRKACKDFYEHESTAIRALNFDEPTYTNLGKPLSPLEDFVNKPFHDYVNDCNRPTDNHICLECGKRYSTSSNLARHRQTHRSVSDKKARKCPHCEKVYVSMPAYSMHVRTHSQGCECPYCGKRFSRPWLLQGHIRTHTGEKPFACPKCGKCFADKSNLRAHIQTHSSEKPYICGRCGKAFALKSYLYKHEESSCMRGQRNKPKDVSLEDVVDDSPPPSVSPTVMESHPMVSPW